MGQFDLFGNEVEIKPFIKSKQTKLTIKTKFRLHHGYKKGFRCKKCAYFNKFRYHGKNYYKCDKVGISHSSATDIRLKDVACNLYLESEGE